MIRAYSLCQRDKVIISHCNEQSRFCREGPGRIEQNVSVKGNYWQLQRDLGVDCTFEDQEMFCWGSGWRNINVWNGEYWKKSLESLVSGPIAEREDDKRQYTDVQR